VLLGYSHPELHAFMDLLSRSLGGWGHWARRHDITFIRFLERTNPRLAKEAFFHILMDFGWIEYEEIMILSPAWRKRRRRREGKV